MLARTHKIYYFSFAYHLFINLKKCSLKFSRSRIKLDPAFYVDEELKVESLFICAVFCLSRPEPLSPGQTNGIGTPEKLTGRFQVSVCLDYWT